MDGTIKLQEEELKMLGNVIKNINFNLLEKDKLLEKVQLELNKK